MKREIKNFLKAFEGMKEASRKLDAVVGPKMKDATEEALMDLTYALPKEYRGLRRIYEAVLRLQEKKEQPEEPSTSAPDSSADRTNKPGQGCQTL